MQECRSPTIDQASGWIVAEIAPEHSAALTIVSAGYFGNDLIRRRIVQAVFRPRRWASPNSVDPEATMALIVHVTLVVLSGVATDLVTESVLGAGRGTAARWRRWRARRRLARRSPPSGGQTRLPRLTATDARRVGEGARRIALNAGVTTEQADLLAIMLAAVLTEHGTAPGAAALPKGSAGAD
ncbi:hypothetical protein [Micromonospora thermarum]|uniref:Uncharacterized protein n=1 Tax=Micromonospora thermarum TaxID=2720024 RepID=A0ABX0Z926_9ACTN|nr:hypothetical protein [Micromonospora thermarum]NJP33759.1 hypothetical protein [Micromonospora thermarum]